MTEKSATTIDNIICNVEKYHRKSQSTLVHFITKLYLLKLILRILIQEINSNWNEYVMKNHTKFLLRKENCDTVLECSDVNQAYTTFLSNLLHCFNIAFIKKILLGKPKPSNIQCSRRNNKLSNMKNFLYDMKDEFLKNSEIKKLYHECTKKWDLSITYDGESVNNETKIANIFNNYFIDTISNLNLSISIINTTSPPALIDTLKFTPIHDLEILKILKSLPNKTSHVFDEISKHLLKSVAESHYFLKLSRNLLSNQYIRMLIEMKLKITAQCLILCIAKVIEKATYSQLTDYLKRNKIICKQKNGLEKGKSTNLALFRGLLIC